MSLIFAHEVDKLKRQLLNLAGMVEESLRKSVTALFERNIAQAEEVIAADKNIDLEEVEIEENCLKCLALHQPVAVDLRFIVSVLKMNNDLERIGDLAVNIAKRTRLIIQEPETRIPEQVSLMAAKCRTMLRDTLDSLVKSDSYLARTVMKADKEVDALNREVYDLMKTRLEKGSDSVASDIHILTIARFLERAADHATNISEDVVYLLEGRIIRHNKKAMKLPKIDAPNPAGEESPEA